MELPVREEDTSFVSGVGETTIVVFAYSADPLTQLGLASLLRRVEHFQLLSGPHLATADVAVVGAERIDEVTLRTVTAIRSGVPHPAVVLAVSEASAASQTAARLAGASEVLRRADLDETLLVESIERAMARGEAGVGLRTETPTAFGPPEDRHDNGLADRELTVLRMLATGCETIEIAAALAVSERTVKNIVHSITTALQARNRPHAVAAAVRAGLI